MVDFNIGEKGKIDKSTYRSKKGEGLFTATLLKPKGLEVAILILAGDGSSDCLQEGLGSEETFPQFLERHLPDKVDIILDAEHLTFVGSLLLGTLGNLFYNKKKNEMLFATGGDFEVQKKLGQLVKLYGINENQFIFWLDEALERVRIPDSLRGEIFAEKAVLGIRPSLSPEMNFIRRALGKDAQVDNKLIRAKQYLERLYQQGFFRLGERDNVLVLTAPLFQLVVFLYFRDVLLKYGLLEESGEEPGKLSQSELEWIVHEVMENSRTHGYDLSDFGMVFAYYEEEKDYLKIVVEDHGGGRFSAHRGAHGASLMIQNILLEKFSEEAYRGRVPPVQFNNGFRISQYELGLRREKAKQLIRELLKHETPLEESGPGFQVVFRFPLKYAGSHQILS